MEYREATHQATLVLWGRSRSNFKKKHALVDAFLSYLA